METGPPGLEILQRSRRNMKQLIVIMATILLGIFVFQMMTGEAPDSLKSVTRDMMIENIAEYRKIGESIF